MGPQYATPPSCDAGLDFKFQYSDEITAASVARDRPPGRKHAIQTLREMYFASLRHSEGKGQTSRRSEARLSVAEPSGFAPLANVRANGKRTQEIAVMLGPVWRRRLEPRWYEIAPDAKRDQAIEEVLADSEVHTAWNEILYLVGSDTFSAEDHSAHTAQESNPAEAPDRLASSAQERALADSRQDGDTADMRSTLDPRKIASTALHLKDMSDNFKETKLDAALHTLVTLFRRKIRDKMPALQAQEEKGWGTCRSYGRHKVDDLDPLDKERSHPDLPIFSDLPVTPDKTHVNWSHIVSFITAKFSAAEDLGTDVTKQGFRYQRNIIQHHPITGRSHHLTVCGHLVRLWSFTPNAYSTSRAYSLWKQEDRLAIGRLLALLTVAKPNCLLQQWLPPQRFQIDTPDRTVEDWEWSAGSLQVVHSRNEIWGSRTVIFAGRAKLASPENGLSAERKALLDLDGARPEQLTMIKCVFLPDRGDRHELNMQHHLRNLPSTPKPMGLIRLDHCACDPLTLSTPHSDKTSPSRDFRVIAFQHRLGRQIPQTMSEKHLAKIFLDVTQELMAYADRGAHYRDLNDGNILYTDGDAGLPRALICDHGNMRLGVKSWATGRVQSRLDSIESLQQVAQDDARSANPLFRPVSMSHVEEALAQLPALSKPPPDDSPTRSPQGRDHAQSRRERRLKAKDEAIFEAYLYSHSYTDDLESLCYVQVWQGLNRSFEEHRMRYLTLYNILRDVKEKRTRWESGARWERLLSRFCTAMSPAWRRMMMEMRDIIARHQKLRRDRLKERVIGHCELSRPKSAMR